MDSLARKIKETRLSKGWTQMETAKQARVSSMVIYNLESGKGLRPSSIPKIANALGLDGMELAKLLMERYGLKED